MKAIALSLLSLVLASSAWAWLLFFGGGTSSPAGDPQPPAADGESVRQLREQNAALETRVRELSARLVSLEARTRAADRARGPAAAVGKRAADGADGSLAGNGAESRSKAEPSEAAASGDAAAGQEEKRAEKLAAFLEELLTPGTSSERNQAIWGEIRKAGLMDKAIQAFEERVRENPREPDRHSELGSAYLQKLFTESDIEKGNWAAKADKAFDEALALNPKHWAARFQKAISLSFWPPIMGKQPEAIRNFETLVADQDGQPVRPEFAQTYHMLGNLYLQRGEKEKAAATWKKGAALFPNDRELSQRITESEGEK